MSGVCPICGHLAELGAVEQDPEIRKMGAGFPTRVMLKQ
jgi:hypothetical protein